MYMYIYLYLHSPRIHAHNRQGVGTRRHGHPEVIVRHHRNRGDVVQHISEPCPKDIESGWETGHACIHPLTIHAPLHSTIITEIYSMPCLILG